MAGVSRSWPPTHAKNSDCGPLLRCCVCKERKEPSEFNGDRSRSCGKSSRCRPCDRERARTWFRRKGRVSKHREWRKLLRQYGLDEAAYLLMLQAQGGGCAICRGDGGGRRLSVDHCHTTGRVRALLCQPCNLAIGSMRERPEIAESAAAYLRQHALLQAVRERLP